MPVFLPPTRASKSARATYLVQYLRQMATNNRKIADGYATRDGKTGQLVVEQYYAGRAAAFAEAAACLVELGI